MCSFKEAFTDYLDAQNVKWVEEAEHVISVTYTGDNIASIKVNVFFDDDKPMLALRCWNIANFKNKASFTDKVAEGIALCNELNNEYRWTKFSLTKSNDIVCSMDTYSPTEDEEIFGAIGLNAVRRIVSIVDEAYPKIMQTLWR